MRALSGVALTAALLLGAEPLAARADASTPASDDARQIRALLDGFARAFHDRDVPAIMSMYAPGEDLVAYDVVPPLQYRGYAAYQQDYAAFLAQFAGPITVEYRDMHVGASGDVGYAFGLERMAGKLTSGEASDMWVRFTSVFRKIGGRWYDVHDHISVPADLASGKAMMALTP